MLNATLHTPIPRTSVSQSRRVFILVVMVLSALWLTGCDNMVEQPKFDEPYMRSPTFGRAARELDPNAVAVGFLRDNEHFYNGTIDGAPATTLPMELTSELFARGQEQYRVFCGPCHGSDGYGDGIISQEGFPQPASFHIDRLRTVPIGHFYQVITNGQNAMFSYASRIKPEDRWAIAAYIRALQFSQNATFADLPTELQAQFESLEN